MVEETLNGAATLVGTALGSAQLVMTFCARSPEVEAAALVVAVVLAQEEAALEVRYKRF